MRSTIMICDDDPDIRAAMRRTLRGYDIVEASSSQEAKGILKTRQFDAVVSDFAMEADGDGLDLLLFVKVQQPETIRFLVTASRDIDTATRAINEGSVHRYFLKPWNDDAIRAALEIVLHSRNWATVTCE